MSEDTKIYNTDEVEGRSVIDDSVVEIKADPFSGSLSFMESEHVRIHAGDGFGLSGLITGLASAATFYLYINPSIATHWRDYSLKADGGPVQIELFENPTVTADGSLLTSYNRNRFSTHTASVDIYSGPTVTLDGTRIYIDALYTTGAKGGETEGVPLEWILNSARTYLLKITNNDANATDMVYQFFWYELDL